MTRQLLLLSVVVLLSTACTTAPSARPGLQVTYSKYPVDTDVDQGIKESFLLTHETGKRRYWKADDGVLYRSRRVMPHSRYFAANDSDLEFHRGWTFDALFPLKLGNTATAKKPLWARNRIGMFSPDFETCEVSGKEVFTLQGKMLDAFQIDCRYDVLMGVEWQMGFLYHPDIPVFLRRHEYNLLSEDTYEDLVDIRSTASSE